MATIDFYSGSNTPSNFTIVQSGGYSSGGQAFTGNGMYMSSVSFNLQKIGSPTGNLTAKLYAVTGTYGSSAVPTGAVLATSNNFDGSTLTTSYQSITFTFPTPYLTVNGTNYAVVVDAAASTSSGANRFTMQQDLGGTHPGNLVGYDNFINNAWAAQASQDMDFTASGFVRSTRTHTTSTFKRLSVVKTHTTDTFRRIQVLKTHSTDSLKRKANTKTHTTDMFKRLVAFFTKTFTTDTYLKKTVIRTHTTSTVFRKAYTQTHTTDSLKRKQLVKTHTANTLFRKSFVKTFTTNTYRRKVNVRTHMTDMRSHATNSRSHTTDMLAFRINFGVGTVVVGTLENRVTQAGSLSVSTPDNSGSWNKV